MEFFKTLEIRNKIILTPQQMEAVTTKHRHCLLLACPGSGKTTVITVRTGYLIHCKGINPKQILTLTFTKAAARDMKLRFQKLFENQDCEFLTVHSFCHQIMGRYFRYKGIHKQNLEGSAQKGKNHVLRNIYQKLYQSKPNEEEIEELSNSISYIKNIVIPSESNTFPEEIENNYSHIIPILDAYEKYKDKHQLYDFDDMMIYCYHALEEFPDLCRSISRQYPYIQVDEAQDNSKIQNVIIKKLINNENHLFAVADDDQTIYEWRGAYPEGILGFERDYPDAKILRMEENFRSSQEIVKLSGQFIKNNCNRYDKALMTNNKSYLPVQFEMLDSNKQFAFVVKQIQKRLGSYESQAILYRNNLSAIAIADYLERAGIEFSVKGYRGHFFKHWMLSDIKDFLLFAKTNELSYFQRIYYKTNAYISNSCLDYGMKNVSKYKTIFDAMGNYDKLKEVQKQRIMNLKWQFKNLLRKPMSHVIDHIMDGIGYGDWLNNNAPRLGTSKQMISTMRKILNSIAINCKDILDFVHRLMFLESYIENSMKKQCSVILSTVHNAKGLEFDAVYMIDLLKGIFPKSSTCEENVLEAERRLFYVGMTRARKELFLIGNTVKKGQDENSLFFNEALTIQQTMSF